MHTTDGAASPSATAWPAVNSVQTGGAATKPALWEGSHSTPPWIKLPPLLVQVHRTAGDLQLGGREMVDNLSVTPGGVQEKASV